MGTMNVFCDLVSDGGGSSGGLAYHSTADCPSEDGERVPLCTDFLGPDLGAVEPARDDVEHGEEPQEDKGEGSCSGTEALRETRVGVGARFRSFDECGYQEQSHSLSQEGDQQGLASADAINDQSGSSSAKDAKRVDEASHPSRLVRIESGELEQDARPGCDDKDTCPLLDLLENKTHDCATTKMQLAGVAATQEEIDVVIALVLSVFDDSIELLKLLPNPLIFLGEVASKLEKNFDGVVSAAICPEPSW